MRVMVALPVLLPGAPEEKVQNTRLHMGVGAAVAEEFPPSLVAPAALTALAAAAVATWAVLAQMGCA